MLLSLTPRLSEGTPEEERREEERREEERWEGERREGERLSDDLRHRSGLRLASSRCMGGGRSDGCGVAHRSKSRESRYFDGL